MLRPAPLPQIAHDGYWYHQAAHAQEVTVSMITITQKTQPLWRSSICLLDATLPPWCKRGIWIAVTQIHVCRTWRSHLNIWTYSICRRRWAFNISRWGVYWASIHYAGRRLFARSREISKPRCLTFKLSYRSQISQAFHKPVAWQIPSWSYMYVTTLNPYLTVSIFCDTWALIQYKDVILPV